VPINFSNIVGYRGTSGSGSQTIFASAMAKSTDYPVPDCITSLSTSGTGFSISGNGGGGGNGNGGGSGGGGNGIDLGGCAVQVNGNATCSGINSSANALYYFVSGTNGNNGNGQNCSPSNGAAPQVTDPYSSRYPRTNIPANNCNPSATNPDVATNYWQQSGNYGGGNGNGNGHGNGNGNGNGGGGSGPSEPYKNLWDGTKSPVSDIYCGDVTATANTSIGPGTYVIENGSLIISPGVTVSGTGVTFIFTGPTISGFSPSHLPPVNGTLDISAPTSGTWSGVALYQDPNLTSGVNWGTAGAGPTWDVTGLIYMPNSNISFSGNINKATNGANCFTMVDWTFSSNGTVNINEQQTGCTTAGLTPPTSNLRRPILVQ
jgi:hypothetical protein